VSAEVWPFVLCELIVLALLLEFSVILLFLPETMMQRRRDECGAAI